MENLPEKAKPEHFAVTETGVFLDPVKFETVQRVAKLFAASTIVPKQYQGNVADCVIALDMAARLRMNPIMVMQSLYVVHGRPGFSGQFIHAMLNRSKIWEPLQFEYARDKNGDVISCTASSKHIKTGKAQSVTLTWDTVQKEGWDKDKSGFPSKWRTMRQQMFTYRTASFFCKAYAPELLLGIDSVEEIEDMPVIDVKPNAEGAYDQVQAFGSEVEGNHVIADPKAAAPLEDQPQLDGNWWDITEHWRFRKAFDFFLAVMAGFGNKFPPLEEDNSVEIDGNVYMLDMDALALFTTFKQSNPKADGSLTGASKETIDLVRKKFVYNLKIDGSLFDMLQAGGA